MEKRRARKSWDLNWFGVEEGCRASALGTWRKRRSNEERGEREENGIGVEDRLLCLILPPYIVLILPKIILFYKFFRIWHHYSVVGFREVTYL